MTKIEDNMDFDDWRQAWFAAARAKGHTLCMAGDYVDQFVIRYGWHHGPGCQTCGWSACMHCDFKAESIPQCSGDPQ